MIKTYSLFLILLTCMPALWGQNQGKMLTGEVSFVTSNNVYVKFDNTSNIEKGDSLILAPENSLCLLVTAKSSRSVVCIPINSCQVTKGKKILYRIKSLNSSEPVPNNEEVEENTEPENTLTQVDLPDSIETSASKKPAETIRGRFSLSNYQNIASSRDNRNRLMSRFWVDASHINHSKFSFEAQANYRQLLQADLDRPSTYFNVYNLALIYEGNQDLSITLGRKINQKTASLGAIDGLQVEKYFGNSYLGAIIGSRPDIITFNPNPSLIEYGGYIGRESRKKNLYGQTTLGFIEQRNAGKIDRRYAYFQHSSTIYRNLSLFSSLEIDLYQSVNGVATNTLRVPNLYVSGTYRFGRKASFMVSYDSRKRILYYETFQTEIERLLDDDLAREGLRSRLNIRPIKYLNIGLSYSRRFQNDRQNKSDNIHGSLSYSKLPKIGGRVSITYNINQANYLNSNILSTRYSRTIIAKKLDADFYYRMADYRFINSERIRRQHYYGVNIGIHPAKKWSLRLAGERADFNQETNYRIYLRLIWRFYRKKPSV